MKYYFRIEGDPVARAEKIARRGNTCILYDARKKEKTFIKGALRLHHRDPLLTGYLRLYADYFIKIPASASKKKRAAMLSGDIRPNVKPDLSNFFKLYEDCLTGTVIEDDRLIVSYGASDKWYAPIPCTLLTIETLDSHEQRRTKSNHLAHHPEEWCPDGFEPNRWGQDRCWPEKLDCHPFKPTTQDLFRIPA
jgi:Holliday junction resolvase RusA-like endonuclease